MRVICPPRKTIRGLPARHLAPIYAKAAGWLEENGPCYDAHLAIMNVTARLSFRTRAIAGNTFTDNFGCWIGNDEGVLMLCFAATLADAGDL